MPIKKQLIQPTGMMQDNLITSLKSNQFAHEIKNLRFNTQGDYVTASWSVEQSTLYKEIHCTDFNKGYLENQIPIGQAVINNQWILFTTTSDDYAQYRDSIIKLYYGTGTDSDVLYGSLLYKGNLNFDKEHPIETIVFYETEDIQKVYWTDGINQPRVINICNTYTTTLTSDFQFDFVKEVALSEDIQVYKQQGGNGQFPAGTVKYAVTYYNKYGQESNIVWTSDLLYPTKGDRALKEDELSGDIFVIKINNVDIWHKYDYIRLYSIVRATDGSVPVVRIVESKSLKNNPTEVVFYDSNTKGEIIDPSILNYIGGVKITAETFDQKDNTLFLGNINLKTKALRNVKNGNNPLDWTVPLNGKSGFICNKADYLCKDITIGGSSGFYPYKNQMNGGVTVYRGESISVTPVDNMYIVESPKVFKYGEWYRFGVQCQDINGVWSDVIHIGDWQNTVNPVSNSNNTIKSFPVFTYTIKKDTALALSNNGYKKIRCHFRCIYT